MAALHDFYCHTCRFAFEAVSTYNDDLQRVDPEPCPDCTQPCGMIWLTAPSLKADGNISAEEKVAAAMRMGIFNDGKMSIPQTRSDMRKIHDAYGDFPVGEKELLTRPARRQRTDAEKDADKRETIEMIRKRRAHRRAGVIPRAEVESEVARAAASMPITNDRVLAYKK